MTSETLIGPVKTSGKFGYVTPTGAYAIKPLFDELGDCSEGLISFRQSGQIWFMDLTGMVVIAPSFDSQPGSLPVFRSGLAAVVSNGRCGYLDVLGTWRISPDWDWGWNYKEDYALVESRDGYFVIDQYGSIVSRLDVWDIQRWPDWVRDWSCFRCVFATINGFAEGCIDLRGRTVFPPVHKRLTDFHSGVAAFSNDDDCFGLVRFDGELVKEPQYYGVSGFSQGLAAASRRPIATTVRTEVGFINLAGEWVIEPRFSQAFPFSEGLARVAVASAEPARGARGIHRTYGFIDRCGELVVEPKYTHAADFSSGFSVVQLQGKYSVIDSRGKEIWREE